MGHPATARGARTTSSLRSILFVAYHYPPIRSGGVERTLKFQRYLPEFGYRPVILTTSAFGPCTEAGDPPEAGILRAWEPVGLYRRAARRRRGLATGSVPSYERTEPGRLGGLRAVLNRHVFIPDGQITWLPHALVRALRALRREPFAALYSTSPPASAHLLGLLLKRLTGLPWLADYRDAWTYDPLDPALSDLPQRLELERRMEGRVVEAADLVVTATRITAQYLHSSYPACVGRTRVIPNGFDPEDLPLPGPKARPSGDRPMRLVHTGTFSASHPRRSPAPLLEALEHLLADDPAWARRLRLVLAGPLSNAERARASTLLDAGMVEIPGPVPRPRALELQRDADVLVLMDPERPWPASNVPGKLYEYLGARRPILAICGPGMIEELIHELKAGMVVRPRPTRALADALVRLYDELTAPTPRQTAPPCDLRPFHRRVQAGQLARCFDRLLQDARRHL